MKRIPVLFTLLILLNSVSISRSSESWKVYDDTQTALIEITMNPADLSYMFANPQLDNVHYCSVHFKNAHIDQVIDSVGIRLRGNTSRVSEKKSFKLSFNEYVKGQDLLGLEKLNLNGEHNDPSIMRSKTAWDIAKQIGMTSSRAAHCIVYINNKYYGVYISVEHIDEEFIQKNFSDDAGNLWKCLYPADLSYQGDSPAQYNFRAYELTTNKDLNDYSQLIRLMRIIKNTPQTLLPDSLESILDIRSVLKYFALNMLIGSWDDYRFNQSNYYLYLAPKENKFYWIPYDYDNTFGISWSSSDWTTTNPYAVDSKRPMCYKLLSIPEYRNLYTHFLEYYNNNVYRLDSLKSNIDRIRNLISGWALNDSFRVRDYGFTFADFLNSYSETPFQKYHVKRGLKEFIKVKNSSLPAQLSYLSQVKPVVYALDWYPKNPGPADSIYVSASAFSKDGLKSLNVNLKKDGTDIDVPMKYSPVQKSKLVEEADRWTGVIAPLSSAKEVNLSITAEDINSLSQKYPRGKEIALRSSLVTGPVVINELLAGNATIITDENGEYDDWIELYNSSAQSVDIGGKYITDNPANLDKWEIPSGTSLSAGGHLLIWCDEDSSQGSYHANFKLSGDGEFLALVDNDGSTILDSLSFPAQTTDVSYGRFPDGSANWQNLYPTPLAGNSVTSVEGDQNIPESFTLSAFPNPFNPGVNISYSLPVVSDVSINIYDMLGKELFSYKEDNKTAGKYNFNWNAANYSTGTYICTIQANNSTKALKLLFLK